MTSTDDSPPSPDHPLVLRGELERQTDYQPAWTTLLRPIQTFVGLLPSHKNTRKGRRSARQIKILVGVVGFIAVVAAESIVVTILGLVALGVAPWFPISQNRKITWIRELKRLREPRARTETCGAQVRFDGRQLAVERDGDRVRRISVDLDRRPARMGTADDRLYLKVPPGSGKSSNAVWIGTDALEAGELPDDWNLEEFDTDAIDEPTLVDGDRWRELADSLRGEE